MTHPSLALLQELIDESPEEKQHRKNEILRRFAFHQFTQHKFEDSLKNYLEIKEGEVTVQSYYPYQLFLIPHEYKYLSISVLIDMKITLPPPDPVNVIGLYPHLLPSDIRQSLSKSQPTRPPTLSGPELEEGMKHLITYLTQVSVRMSLSLFVGPRLLLMCMFVYPCMY